MNSLDIIVAAIYGLGVLITAIVIARDRIPLSPRGVIGAAILASGWPWLLVVHGYRLACECVDEVLP